MCIVICVHSWGKALLILTRRGCAWVMTRLRQDLGVVVFICCMCKSVFLLMSVLFELPIDACTNFFLSSFVHKATPQALCEVAKLCCRWEFYPFMLHEKVCSHWLLFKQVTMAKIFKCKNEQLEILFFGRNFYKMWLLLSISLLSVCILMAH